MGDLLARGRFPAAVGEPTPCRTHLTESSVQFNPIFRTIQKKAKYKKQRKTRASWGGRYAQL